MNIRFIDTSIVMNLLRIPHMCQEYESVKKEFNEAIEQNETLILPLATIIESGNHISHIADGNIRREKAVKFQEFLRKTAKEEAPGELYGVGFTKEDLLIIADQFPDCAQKMEMGIGDMSIIRFYEKYKNEVPAVGRIMIWSKDKHLSCYQDNLSISRRREK